MAVTTNFGVPVDGDNEATLMPKLAYRFRVVFTNLGNGKDGKKTTQNVISVSRPALDHEEVIVDTYNSKIKLAGKHSWQDITLVLRDDVDNEVITAIASQLNQQVNHADQSGAFVGANYKFGMSIETLDGGNADNNENVLDSWELAGCFISSAQYGDLNYGSGSEMVQVTLTIKYDNAAHIVGSTDQLSIDTIDGAASETLNATN
jgi:hypothetical protein